jgi:hypothetical protein
MVVVVVGVGKLTERGALVSLVGDAGELISGVIAIGLTGTAGET